MCAFGGFDEAVMGEDGVVFVQFDAGLQAEFCVTKSAGEVGGCVDQSLGDAFAAMIWVDGHFAEVEAIGVFSEEGAGDWHLICVENEKEGFVCRLSLDISGCEFVER